MNEQLQSLSKIFTDKLLRIPDYQRGYAWTERQLNDFWNDLELLGEKHNHYAGVITLDDVPQEVASSWSEDLWIMESRGYKPYYVVDGQQRITTSIILIQCILESFPQNELLNFTDIVNIRKRFIYESYDEKISRAYIFGYEFDNPSHEFLKTEIFMQHSDKTHSKDLTIYTHNLELAKKFFLDKLKGLGKEQIELVYRKLTQNFLFNIYSISNEIDTHVSFETMNNRGKALSHLELLKNRLIYLSTRLEDTDHEKNKLRDTINSAWSSIYHHLGRNKDNPLDDDTFLRSHFILYFDVDDGQSQEEGDIIFSIKYHPLDYKKELLENIFTVKNLSNNDSINIRYIYDYVKSLKSSIEVWYKISNPKDSGYSKEEIILLRKIQMLAESSSNQIIMAIFLKEKNKVNRMKFLETLERNLFIQGLFLPSGRLPYMDTGYSGVTRKYYSDEIGFEKLIALISKGIDTISNSGQLLSMVSRITSSSHGFYRWGNLKYLLYEYEQSLRVETRNTEVKIEDWWLSAEPEDSIEHIYPQTVNADCWRVAFNSLAPTEKSVMKHAIGNLVPINRRKNSSLRNGCFETKKGSSSKKVGYKYGTYSEIEICENESWGPLEIINRSIKLLKFMERRWQVKLGNEDEKMKALNFSKIYIKIKK